MRGSLASSATKQSMASCPAQRPSFRSSGRSDLRRVITKASPEETLMTIVERAKSTVQDGVQAATGSSDPGAHFGSRAIMQGARSIADTAQSVLSRGTEGSTGVSGPSSSPADVSTAIRGLSDAFQGALSSAGAVGTDIERITRDTVAIWRDIEALASGTGESAARIAQDTTAVASDYSTLASDAISAASAPAFAALAPISAALRSLSDAVSSVLLDPTQAASAPDGTPLLLSGALQPSAAAVLFAGAAAAAAATLLAPRKREIAPGSFDVDPDLPREYDVEALRSYYASRPVELATRTMEAAAWVGSTGAGILMDRATGKVAENEAMRARQVREACEHLGPAYVKVAQALSTRGDILSEAYMTEVVRLQDEVRPFSTAEAMEIMREDFGRDPSEIFSEITPEPIAAASLGQVYRARLREAYGGQEVAVKVQRPDVLPTVALDLFIIREACRISYAVAPELVGTDFAPVIDEWAVRFFREMDYTVEMQNALRFAEDMKELEGIVVPKQYPEITSRRVLVTEWINGEKLVTSSASDVRVLCDTLLNCYLIQLLESGFLHADPHPGNLLRTPDGKICILDYGLMTDVTPDKQYAFVEYIAHLTTSNWRGVAKDLVNLGFAPEGYEDLAEVDGFLELIEQVLSVLVSGGGADKVQERAKQLNIGTVLEELEEMSKDYKFVIPPYFALVLRSFSVIEGIALRVDPDYAIVQECFPYLSRRLLADDTPRMKKALRDLLYADGNRINLERFQKLANGFGQFTTDGIGARGSLSSASGASTASASTRRGEEPLLDRTAVTALKVVFRKEGSYIADLLVEELAATINALSREAAIELSRLVLTSAATTTSRQAVAALGPLRPFVAPFPLPSEVLAALMPAVRLTEEDRIAVNNVRILWGELQGMLGRSMGAQGQDAGAVVAQEFLRALRETGDLLPELAPGLQRASGRLWSDLARKTAQRLAEDLEAAQNMELV